ncbi:MAG: hypothetical protein H0U27_03920, partial [Nitrosopumilus sp.]|nr:hypothetical protein [Nitrosopumilus sp.]
MASVLCVAGEVFISLTYDSVTKQPTFELYRYLKANYNKHWRQQANDERFNTQNRKTRIVELSKSDKNKKVLMNQDAFLAWSFANSKDKHDEIQAWTTEHFTYKQKGRPRLPVQPNNTVNVNSTPQDVLKRYVSGSKSEKKKISSIRRDVVAEGLKKLGLAHTLASVIILVHLLLLAEGQHVDDGTNDKKYYYGSSSVRHYLDYTPSGNKIKREIQQEILDEVEVEMTKRNLLLFATAQPTKRLWETFREVMQGAGAAVKDYKGIPFTIGKYGLKLPKILYSFQHLQNMVKEFTEHFWPYKDLENVKPGIGLIIKENAIMDMLVSYWKRNEKLLPDALRYHDILTPYNSNNVSKHVLHVSCYAIKGQERILINDLDVAAYKTAEKIYKRIYLKLDVDCQSFLINVK